MILRKVEIFMTLRIFQHVSGCDDVCEMLFSLSMVQNFEYFQDVRKMMPLRYFFAHCWDVRHGSGRRSCRPFLTHGSQNMGAWPSDGPEWSHCCRARLQQNPTSHQAPHKGPDMTRKDQEGRHAATTKKATEPKNAHAPQKNSGRTRPSRR